MIENDGIESHIYTYVSKCNIFLLNISINIMKKKHFKNLFLLKSHQL